MVVLRSGRFLLRQFGLTTFFGPAITLAGLLAVGYFAATGGLDLSDLDVISATADPTADAATAIQPVSLDRAASRPADRIRIATFNIQAFGEKKSSDPELMQVIARIVASFDLVAIQEVRSPRSMPVARLVDLLNRSGGRYEATVSEPIGRSTYTEQYAFIWDASRIRLIPDSAYVVNDDADRMHREPMVASFEARVSAAQGRVPFRFTIINAHTSPEEVSPRAIANEMNVLDDVFVRVREYEYATRGEDDVLLVGDLNVDVGGLGELGQIPGIHSIAGNTPTNTLGTKTYDHILIDRNVTAEFSGVFGVVDYERDFGLSPEQAARVSDHRPVWAEFSALEIDAFAPVAAGAATIR